MGGSRGNQWSKHQDSCFDIGLAAWLGSTDSLSTKIAVEQAKQNVLHACLLEPLHSLLRGSEPRLL